MPTTTTTDPGQTLVTAPARTRPAEKPATRPQKQPPYAVILYNDNINGFDYVVHTLKRVFGYGTGKAFRLTLKAHFTGRSVLWSGMKEHAEFKADQVRSCGPDPMMMHKGAAALRVSIEPQAG